ncbi:MAG: hypothetical protein C5B56_04520 [Proteobacteria bacterium]|nr:MAG: hypothetical protein C5B56_04520 [Pseudomonadota bacterium]
MIAGPAIAANIGHLVALRLQGVAPAARALWSPPADGSRLSQDWLLPRILLALKIIASVLASGAVALILWREEPAPHFDRFNAAFQPFERGSNVIRGAPQEIAVGEESAVEESVIQESAEEREIYYPRSVKIVRFTPPAQAPSSLISANPLAGKPLRYLIGAQATPRGNDSEVTEVPYGAERAKRGISIAYCNLFDEHNTGKYGPYLRSSDTAKQYNEGQIDPRGPGWEKNLREQFELRRKQGFEYIELDNPDAYTSKDVIGAIELAATYGLKVIAKNPGLVPGATAYVAHPNVHGIIVEKGAGGAPDMDALRRRAGKPDLPVWFVAFGSGRGWAGSVAGAAKKFRNMAVTYSSAGEYGNAIDILPPT